MARNTLQTLRALIWVLWLAEVTLLAATFVGAELQSFALQAVGRNSAPSVVAAQQIRTALAAMDADALRALLTGVEEGAAMKDYEMRRQQAAGALLSAAENITYGEAERDPIRKLQLGLGTYEARFSRARDLYAKRDPAYLAAYREAFTYMEGTLLPAADALDAENLQPLESGFSAQKTRSLIARGAVIVASIVLLFLLIAAQTFLSRRTNRILNLPLLAATLLAMGWSGWAIETLSREQSGLRLAKEDAFDSIHTLWRARSVGQQLRADEFRFLLDKEDAPAQVKRFEEHASGVLQLPRGITQDELTASARGPGNSIPRSLLQNASGLLADELHNVTFDGEKRAALQCMFDLRSYLDIDSRVRLREAGGKHADAVLMTASSANQAHHAFDVSLGAAILINQNQLDRAIAEGFSALRYFGAKSTIFAVVVGILSLVGLLQRIAEYR